MNQFYTYSMMIEDIKECLENYKITKDLQQLELIKNIIKGMEVSHNEN